MVFWITAILLCQLVGEAVVTAAGLALPGPVLGMVILFAGLMIGGLPERLARVADALLDNLSLLFVPAGVGVMLHAGLLGRDWLPIAVALVASTLATVAVTGLVMARFGPGNGSGGEDSGTEAPGGAGGDTAGARGSAAPGGDDGGEARRP